MPSELTGTGRLQGTSRVLLGLVLALVLSALLIAPAARAALPPQQDPFYAYGGGAPLGSIAPGTVLKTRTRFYHVAGLPLPVKALQLLYRSTRETGEPTVNVTSVLRAAAQVRHARRRRLPVLLRLAQSGRRALLCDLAAG